MMAVRHVNAGCAQASAAGAGANEIPSMVSVTLETKAANRSAFGMGFIVDLLLPFLPTAALQVLPTAALQAVAISQFFLTWRVGKYCGGNSAKLKWTEG
jgi:hypothetical protein